MRTPAWLALLFVVAAVAPASALAAPPADGGESVPQGTTAALDAAPLGDEGRFFQTEAGEADAPTTTVEISLREDRSAFWRVEAEYALETENETAAFRRVADRYESGEADVGPDAMLFETLQRRAAEATGREMAIGNVTYHSSVDDASDRGTLSLTFRWTNFLRAGENGTLVLDDAFRLPSAEEDRQRTWLSIFDESQQIRIRPPEGYTVTSTSIPVQQRENAVVLAEPSDFEGESALRIAYSPVGTTDQFPAELLAGIGIVAVVAVVGVWALRRRPGSDTPDDAPTDTGDAPTGTAPSDSAGTPVDADETSAAAASVGSVDADDEDDVDLSLLSDEERVERLLERNDGRMKQATIVDEMGWSDAKVSQLLSAMADEGRIDKLRLGRENLISLPDDADVGDGPGDGGNDTGGADEP